MNVAYWMWPDNFLVGINLEIMWYELCIVQFISVAVVQSKITGILINHCIKAMEPSALNSASKISVEFLKLHRPCI